MPIVFPRTLREEDPTWKLALLPACLLSALLYSRPPGTDFIFDEREAIRANPYVRAAADPSSAIGWLDAFRRDFWGLTPERTIAAYRPLPDLVWRAMWRLGMRDASAFPFHAATVLLHGINGALLVVLAFRWTADKATAWLAGGIFVATAVITEAVSNAVGLADVAAGTAALLALLALDLPPRRMALGVAGAVTLGLFAKESAVCLVPLVPLAALLTPRTPRTPGAPTGPDGGTRTRALMAAFASTTALVAYVVVRRLAFPVRLAPGLPGALDNPLAFARPSFRIAGALRIYASGLGQLLVPGTLSADYSAQQETAPREVASAGMVIGALAMLAPLVIAVIVGIRLWRRRRADARPAGALPLVAFALLWMVVAYFPVSNVPFVLPTVRAERFFYLPAIGSAVALAVGAVRVIAAASARGGRVLGLGLVGAFISFQAFAARRHALDYRDELTFWRATCETSPRSAKAHLNLGAVLGAHGDLEGQLAANTEALRLAPRWSTASVYQGEALCRLHRVDEAIPHLVRGLDPATNDDALVGLALGCLRDEHALADGSRARAAMESLATRHPGSRLAAALRDAMRAPTVPAP